MGINWNDEADAKLLVAILNTSESRPNNAAIARYMGTLGLECTASSIQHRIHRLKDKAKPLQGEPENKAKSDESTASAAAEGPSAASPEKPVRKRGRPPKKQAEPTAPEEEQPSPSKKANTGEATSSPADSPASEA